MRVRFGDSLFISFFVSLVLITTHVAGLAVKLPFATYVKRQIAGSLEDGNAGPSNEQVYDQVIPLNQSHVPPGVYTITSDGLQPRPGWLIVLLPQDVKDQLQPPQWLDGWEDAEFAGKDYDTGNILGGDEGNVTLKAAYYLLSMTGGYWFDGSHNIKRSSLGEKLDDDVLNYFQTGDDLALQNIHNKLGVRTAEKVSEEQSNNEKRANACFFRNAWTRSRSNAARVAALGALSDLISGSCQWMVLGRSAFCGKDGGDQACVSWDGGWQSMKGCAAKAVLESAVNQFGGNEDISAYCAGCLHTWDHKRKRGNEHDEQSCVSDRPNGCLGHLWRKRFNWDDDSYGWCYGSPF